MENIGEGIKKVSEANKGSAVVIRTNVEISENYIKTLNDAGYRLGERYRENDCWVYPILNK